MAIHDYNLANAAGIVFRSDLNDALAAIVSQNSSATEPTTMFAYMFWADTTTAILKQRNSLNAAWNSLFNLSTGQWLGSISGNAATVSVADAAADTTTWPMLARSQTGDQGVTTDAGLTYDASTNTLSANISSPSILSSGAIRSSSAISGIGYTTGAGASITQTPSVTSACSANVMCGVITRPSYSWVSGTPVTFTLNDIFILSSDVVIASVGGIYGTVGTQVGSSFVNITMTPAQTLTGVTTINFSIIKVTSS